MKGKIEDSIVNFTSDEGQEIVPPQLTEAEISRSIARYDDFVEQLVAGKPLPELVLSAMM